MLLNKSQLDKLCNFTINDHNKRLCKNDIIASISKINYFLYKNNILPESKIGVALAPSVDAAIAIYSIVLFACCYVPLDINSPIERLNYIITNSNAVLVIGKGEKPAWCKCMWLDIDSLNDLAPRLYVNEVKSDFLAAILYTSGSTGVPKGVALSHRAMSNFVRWSLDTFNVIEKDNICNIAPFHFDLSVFDLFVSIQADASLYILPRNYVYNLTALKNWFKDNHISIIYTVPSFLNFLSNRSFFDQNKLNSLRLILFAGEVMPVKTARELIEYLPSVEFYNLYGPTETNVCSYWPVDKKQIVDINTIPIGYAACAAILKIDQNNNELLVKGDLLMSGYWVNNSFDLPFDEEGYYHTGDKVSYDESGALIYHGRLDDMIKYYGHRIEPLEIENTIRKYESVTDVIVFSIDGMEPNIIACILSKKSNLKKPLLDYLKNHLPQYMIPTEILEMDSFPKLSNGKFDKVTLKQLVKSQLLNKPNSTKLLTIK